MSPLSSEIYWMILAMNCQMMPSTVVFLQGMFLKGGEKPTTKSPSKSLQALDFSNLSTVCLLEGTSDVLRKIECFEQSAK